LADAALSAVEAVVAIGRRTAARAVVIVATFADGRTSASRAEHRSAERKNNHDGAFEVHPSPPQPDALWMNDDSLCSRGTTESRAFVFMGAKQSTAHAAENKMRAIADLP
jgi:hypothetical protein